MLAAALETIAPLSRPRLLRGLCGVAALVLSSVALLSAARAGEPATLRLAIVQPGYPGSPTAAKGFLASLGDYLEARLDGGVEIAATYHNLPREALTALERSPPDVAIVSPGFYLEHRKSFDFKALLEAVPEDRYFLVARPGTRLADLRGKEVYGGALHEPEFVERLVFPGPQGAATWKGVPSLRTLRELRKLERDQIAAVVLNGREYRAVESLGRLKSLEKILESDYYPPALVVVPRRRQAAEEAGLVKAIREMTALARSDDSEARKLLATMGCDGFRPVRVEWLREIEGKYQLEGKGEEKHEEDVK